jgi:hypothetical protein
VVVGTGVVGTGVYGGVVAAEGVVVLTTDGGSVFTVASGAVAFPDDCVLHPDMTTAASPHAAPA